MYASANNGAQSKLKFVTKSCGELCIQKISGSTPKIVNKKFLNTFPMSIIL